MSKFQNAPHHAECFDHDGVSSTTIPATSSRKFCFLKTTGGVDHGPKQTVGLVVIQNESDYDQMVKFDTEDGMLNPGSDLLHDGPDCQVKSGETRSFQVFLDCLTIYNVGAGAVRYAASAVGTFDKELFVIGWEKE